MKIEPKIEMDLDYLASRVMKLNDINVFSKKQDRQTMINKHKSRLIEVLNMALRDFRELRLKYALLENENKFLRSQITPFNQEILDENERLREELEELRAILAGGETECEADNERLSA